MRANWMGAAVLVIALAGLGALLPGYISADFENAPVASRPTAGRAPDSGGKVTRLLNAPTEQQRARVPYLRVRLALWSLPVDVYAIALFLLLAATGVLWHRSRVTATQEFAPLVLALSVPGIAGLMWCLHQVSFRWRFIAPRYWIAGGALIAIFALSATVARANWTEMWRQSVRSTRRTLASPVTWLAITVLPIAALLSQRPGPQVRTDPTVPTGRAFVSWFASQPRASGMTPSIEEGVVTVLTFIDYECPACKRAEESYRQLKSHLAESSRGVVRFRDIDYPLETECNPLMRIDVHPSACEGAVAVRLARELGRDQAMREWLWRNQSSLSPARIRQAAYEVAGVVDYDAKYPQALKLVTEDVAVGNKIGIMGTPTFLVNGRQLRLVPASDFEAAIRYELAQLAK